MSERVTHLVSDLKLWRRRKGTSEAVDLARWLDLNGIDTIPLLMSYPITIEGPAGSPDGWSIRYHVCTLDTPSQVASRETELRFDPPPHLTGPAQFWGR